MECNFKIEIIIDDKKINLDELEAKELFYRLKNIFDTNTNSYYNYNIKLGEF